LCCVRSAESIARDLDAIVYPVLTLPTEIASEIFVHYVESHPTRNPLRLTWVLAISTCRLWSRWTQCISDFHKGSTTNAANSLPIWLSRTGGLPLNLEFHFTYMPPQDPRSKARVESLYETVSRFSSQLESLTLSSLYSISLPACPFPRLKKLSIADGLLSSDEDDRPHLDAPHLDAPCLREVVLKDECAKALQTALPKTDLTKLVLGANVADCLAILAHTPNLQELDMVSNDAGDVGPSPTFTVLPRLDSIRLGRDASVEILPYLTLPALECLSIRVDPVTHSTANWVNELVTRSGCTLRQVDLFLRHADDGWLDDFLDSVPLHSLRDLALRAPDCNLGHLLRNVAEQPENQLPALESLAIHDCQFYVNLADLVDMLAARTKEVPGVAPLKSFQLSFGMADGPQAGRGGEVDMKPSSWVDRKIKAALEKLHDLRARGLRVEISSDFETLGSGDIDSKIVSHT
ncbi:hypothetical protein FB45DRAFT_898052, partial [Roridomyces roridus]